MPFTWLPSASTARKTLAEPEGDAIAAALPKAAVRKQHMRALPHAEVGAALERVKGSGAYLGTRLVFEFLVLTAARSGEVRNARWTEIDRDGAVWTAPAERMKAGRAHRVPLSPRALAVLDGAAELCDGQGLVFPSPTGRVLNHAALTDLLHGLGIDAVAHGFRSGVRRPFAGASLGAVEAVSRIPEAGDDVAVIV